MDTFPVLLFESASDSLVEAVLHPALTPEQVTAAEAGWAPLRAATRAEHAHWDWEYKAGLLGLPGARCMGVEQAGRMQGMALIREVGYAARLPPDVGRPLIYLDYLESAPWNQRGPGRMPVYRGVGTALFQAVVRRSAELGFAGRVGLHSLTQAAGFYATVPGMVGLGPDPGYFGLGYYELLPAPVVPPGG